jgi:hypothetical protein
MSEQKSPRSLGTGAESWSRYETYTQLRMKWDRIWDGLTHCQLNQHVGPLDCWEIEPARCRDHPAIKSSLDYQQDGRWRMRMVISTGLLPPAPRQTNIRLPVFTYVYFRENPDFRPLPNNKDSQGRKHEYSHLCHRASCINPRHCVYESKPANQTRDWCDAEICQGQHNPPCLTSASNKRDAHNATRDMRQKLRTEPWKRGRFEAEADTNAKAVKKRKQPESTCKQQSITKFLNTSSNH